MKIAQVSGHAMSIKDAFVTAMLGYGVVFMGMLLLIALIVIVSKYMQSRQAKMPTVPIQQSAPTPTKSLKPAPGSAGELKLYNVSERDAAMIMAIVADNLGKPLNELRFLSIRELNNDEQN